MPKRTYKTSQRQRRMALEYYYANKAARLAYGEQWRRAQGIAVRVPAMTAAEKLARIVLCRTCGRRITTPSVLLKCNRLCRRCQMKKYPKAREARRRRVKAWCRKHMAQVRAIKIKRGCEKCGLRTEDPKKLDFHHWDPKTKLFRLGRACRYSWAKTLAEIAKCDVLCKPCHEGAH